VPEDSTPKRFNSVNPAGRPAGNSENQQSSPPRLPPRYLAVLRELRAGMGTGRRTVRSFPRLAKTVGCSYRTAQRACDRLEDVGLIRKIRGGGGFTGPLGIAQANAWIVSRLADSHGGQFSHRPKRREKVSTKEKSSKELPLLDISVRTENLLRARPDIASEGQRRKATATSKAKSGLQKSDFCQRQPLSAEDPALLAYLALAAPFLAGTSTVEVRKAFFRAYRRGANIAELVTAWRAHTAFCLRRQGRGLKRPDTFLDDEYYLRDWTEPALVTKSAPRKFAPTGSNPAAHVGESNEAFEQRMAREAERAEYEQDAAEVIQRTALPPPPVEVAPVAIAPVAIAPLVAAVVRATAMPEPPKRTPRPPIIAPKPPPPPPTLEEFVARAVKLGMDPGDALANYERTYGKKAEVMA
jgi:hypothetical protein